MDRDTSDAFQQAMLKLRTSYLEEVPEKLDRLEHLLLEIEQSSADTEAFDEVFRIVHSMKGSGGTFGLHILTTICHELEDLFSATGGGASFGKDLVAASLSYVDLLRLTREQYRTSNENLAQVEKQLDNLRKQLAPRVSTILLIDNSRLSTKLYLHVLSGLPVKTVVMNDGPNALVRALTEPFDLIIANYELPVLNGDALIAAVKLSFTSNSKRPKTILITSNKKLKSARHRSTDPDETILKDADLAQHLVDAVKQNLAIA